MKSTIITIAISALIIAGCTAETTAEKVAEDVKEAATETVANKEVKKLEAPYVVTSDMYPAPPLPHYGPEPGSIEFVDTDPGETIGGILYMKAAVDENGARVDAAANGITQYMIHWGLEVGEPGTQDDTGAGDLGGDCRGFRDTGHVVMKMADSAGDLMKWEIPPGTPVPEDAKYFVGHALYGKIHNLGKCTQTPIENLIK